MLTYHKVSLCIVQCYVTQALLCVAMFVAAEMRDVHPEAEPSDSKIHDILMKGAKPEKAEAYLCTAYPLSKETSYIYKFEALADAATVHHMILYGCSGEPYSQDPVWTCNAMCSGGPSSIIFSWAKNAPHTVLPKGVGFRIGQNSTIASLVLQVHYAKAFKKEENVDHSGLRIYTTSEEQPFVAGIYLMAASQFTIPQGNPSYPVDVGCDFDMEQSIFPFAYRPHAHSLGKVITGYLYNGSYHEIGKGNPRWPQSFYPVHDNIEVQPNDSLLARCTYDSTTVDHAVSVGSTGKDEMCNFYIMFYTDKSVWDPSGACWGNNKPGLTGNSFPLDVSVPLPPNPELEEDAKGSHHNPPTTETVSPEPQNTTWTMDLLMKGAKPDKPDAYLCAAYPVTDEEAYIYKFEALADASTVHHILVYGCDGEAFSDKPIWQCPRMCKGYKSAIMFAWAKNAPPTVLPKDVGLRIGQRSPIKTIVLQVHYGKSFPEGAPPDHSGIRVYITEKKQPFVAGIYFLGSSLFSIPPGESSYPVDISCSFSMQKSIFPFAYRTHAHGLGKVITGYQHNGTYHMIGKGNPQWPQAFYPVKDQIEVKPGDILAARCTFDSTSMSHRVSVGSTGNDEMCNFYIMFYTNSSVQDPSGDCNGNEIRSLTGDNFPVDVSEPLPPNPELEEAAKGHHHNHHGDADNEILPTQPAGGVLTQDLLIQSAKPDKLPITVPESYLCSAYPVTEVESYILKFEAIANVSTVHHILLYGCDGEPFSHEPNWNCPPVCKFGKMSIMFAWGKNAPPTVFPQGVGMRIGQKSQITTIVLQVHYARVFAADEPTDHSGVRIYTTKEKQPYVAGIYLMASNSFKIPPGDPSYPVDISCKFTKEKSIFPFMYRTHAHNLGKVITGYQYNGSYHQIGKGNPHWPQAFYPVRDKIEVKSGDYMTARCTYDSTSVGHAVGVGPHGDDEMCNLYIMFYTDSSETNPYGECLSNSEPQLTGDSFPSDVSLPLPPNPALEEEAKGHHHQTASGTADSDQNVLNMWSIERNNIDILNRLMQNDNNTQEEVLQGSQRNNKMNMEDMGDSATSRHGRAGEIMQYDYDFDDLDSKIQKRQKQEYYDEYAANDLRENGLYPPHSGGAVEEGRSRNRNKEFEAMNQQIQQFPRKNQRVRPAQHQLELPRKHMSESANNAGGSRADSKKPQNRNAGPSLADSGTAGGKGLPGEQATLYSRIHFEHKLEVNTSWPSEKLKLGQIGGVATDKDGNVYIFHRGSRMWNGQSFSLDDDFMDQNSPIQEDVIVVLNSQGKLLRKFGAGQYFMPHGIEVDKDGNIWLTDVALHQVFKIARGATSPSLVLGHRFQHGSDLTSFCKPTDVAVLSSGEFFVSDGYCNSRVLKFSQNGTLIKAWGERQAFAANPPPIGSFDIPHSITVSEENQLVCVADRENGRVQCFDLDGNFRHVIKHPEFGNRLFAIEQSPVQGGVLYAVNGPSFSGPTDISVQGFTLDIRTGALLETWNVPQHLHNPHDLCVHTDSQSVYVGELNPQTVWKLSRQMATTKSNTPVHVHINKKPNDSDKTGNKVEEHTTVPNNKNGESGKLVSGTAQNKTALVITKESEKSDITPAVLIGCLLVIPVILLLIIILLVRARHSGKLKCCGRSKKRVFSLQGILGNSHKGFDPLNTEESDRDSDNEEYMAPKKIKNKS